MTALREHVWSQPNFFAVARCRLCGLPKGSASKLGCKGPHVEDEPAPVPVAAAPSRGRYCPLHRVNVVPLTPDEKPDIVLGDLKISFSKHQIWWKGTPVHFPISEFKIVVALAERPGVVFERDTLMTRASGLNAAYYERNIDSHIKRIRHRFFRANRAFAHVDTVYGVGYRWLP